MNIRQTTDSKGFVTIPVLGYVFALTLLGTAYLTSLHASLDEHQRVIHDSAGYTLAESGFQYAVIQLNEKPNGFGVHDIALEENHLRLSIQEKNDASTWLIRSTGYIGGADTPLHTVVLEAQLKRSTTGWSLSSPTRLRRYQLEEEMSP